MKRYLWYECKRNLLPLLIFTVVSTVLYLSYIYSVRGFRMGYYSSGHLAVSSTILGLLAALMPIYIYSFAMTKRGADFYFSLPIRREAMYAVKTIVGLGLVILPYTVAYWLGVLYISPWRADMISVVYPVYFLPHYGLTLLAALCLYGLNAFVFTRANTVFDGIWLLVGYTFLFFVLAWFVAAMLDKEMGFAGFVFDGARYWMTFSPIDYLTTVFQRALNKGYVSFWEIDMSWTPVVACAFFGVLGIASYVGLFCSVRRMRIENVGHLTDTWLGYRVTIPLYVFAVLSVGFASDLMLAVFVIVCGLMGYFIYRRSFRLKWYDVVSLIGASALGYLASLVSFGG